MAPTHARRILRILYLINGLASAVAAIVLVVAPQAIPNAVFAYLFTSSESVSLAAVAVPSSPFPNSPEHIMSISGTAYLLAYLLAAAELALATLCGFAFRSSERATHGLAVPVLATWHLASIVAGLAFIFPTQSGLLLSNIVIRLVIVVALFACAKAALRP